MSGNRDELPDRTGQRETTTRSDQLDRRQQLADELGIAPENITTTDTIESGVQSRVTEAGQRQAEQTLRQRFAEQRPNVEPDDVTAEFDPEAMAGQARVASDQRDSVRSRVQQAVAADTEGLDPADVGVDVGAGGVDDVDVDARQLAIERAASQSDQFDADDFQTVDTEDGFETRLTESARERATDQQADALREQAADQLDAFGESDIAVSETDDGLEAGVRDSALREQVIEQAQSSFEYAQPSREDISVEIGEDGASATIAEDVRREEALEAADAQLENFDESDITLTETDDGGFEASVADSAQRQAVREQAAADLDDFGPGDIEVSETDDGFEATVPDSAQREAVRDQAASELDGFSESDISVSETEDGFRAEVRESAQRREVREELFRNVPEDLGPVEQYANPATGEIDRAGLERAENAFESGDLEAGDFQQAFDAFQNDEQLLSDDELADVPTRDPDDVTVGFEPEFETRTITENGEQREVRERVGERATVSLTDEAASEREQLIRESLREDAADELEQFDTEDIRVTETDDGLQAEVRPGAERTFLLSETSETLFATAAGGDTLQAAIDLRPDLQSIPGRDSINSALEDSGSDLRSTAPVGEILQELDPEEVAERQDDLGITADQVRTAQQGIEQERQEAVFNPDEFTEGVDDLDITDALQFDQATEQGRERRSELRQRADEIEQEVASDAGVDTSEVEFRATVDGLEATEETERTIARGRAAQQFGVDASNVTVTESGDGFEASLETDFAEAQALQQAASQTGIDVDLLDADAQGGAVDVGIDRDALAQSVADEQGVAVENVALRETDSGIQAGVSEEVREAQIEREIASEREGVSADQVDAELDSAFDDDVDAEITRAADAAGAVSGAQGLDISNIQRVEAGSAGGDDFGRIQGFGGANFREDTAVRSAAEGIAETGADIGSDVTGDLLDAAGAEPGPDREFLTRVGAAFGAAPGGAAVLGVDATQAGNAVVERSVERGPLAGFRLGQNIAADSANSAISGVDQTFDVDRERRASGEGALVEIEPGANQDAAVTATVGALSLAAGAVGGSAARAGLSRASGAVRRTDIDDVTPDRSFIDDTRAQSQLRRERQDTDAETRTDADSGRNAVELDLERLEDVDLDDISDADRQLLEQVTDQDLDELADTSTSTTTTAETAAVRQLDTRATAAGGLAPFAPTPDVAAEIDERQTDLGVDLAALDEATTSVSAGADPVQEQRTQFTESVEGVGSEAVDAAATPRVDTGLDARLEDFTAASTLGGVADPVEDTATAARETAVEATDQATVATTDTFTGTDTFFDSVEAVDQTTTTATATDTITNTGFTTDTVTETTQTTTEATQFQTSNTTRDTDRPGRPRNLDLPGLEPADTEAPEFGFDTDSELFDSGVASSEDLVGERDGSGPFSL